MVESLRMGLAAHHLRVIKRKIKNCQIKKQKVRMCVCVCVVLREIKQILWDTRVPTSEAKNNQRDELKDSSVEKLSE